MKRFLRRSCLLLTILSCALATMAQQTFFYGSDRLPSSLITALAQDADGLLWVGTEQGLSSFDGYRFTSHHLAGVGQSAVAGNEISSLLATDNGQLWIGTAVGLLCRDRATNQFLSVSFPPGIHPRVSALLQTRTGMLLAGTAGYGLYRIDPDSLQAIRLNDYAPATDNDYFVRLFESHDGTVWKSSPTGHTYGRKPNGQLLHRPGEATDFYQQDGRLQLLSQASSVATTDAEGNVYIGTRGSGLLWKPAGQSELKPLGIDVGGFDVRRARISALLVDRDYRLWVGCRGRGLLMVPLGRKPLFQQWSLARQGYQTGTCVTAIAEGDEGTVWCAVQGGGIYGFDRQGRVIAHPSSPAGVESLLRDAQGRYFIGTTDGLYSYDPVSGNARLLQRADGHVINAMADLSPDLLALSAFGIGMRLIDKTSGRIEATLTMRDTDTLRRGRLCNDWIHAFDVDNRGRLWIGTASGVSCFDPNTRSFRTEGWNVLRDNEACTALLVRKDGHIQLSNDLPLSRAITFMAEDTQGELWVAATDGLYRFGPTDSVASAPLGRMEFVQGAGLQTSDGRILLGMADGLLVFHPDSVRQRHGTTSRVHLTALRIGGEVATMQTRSGRHRVMQQPVMDCRHFRLSYAEAAFQLEFSRLEYADVHTTTFQYRMEGDSVWQQIPEGQNSIAFNHLAPGKYRLQVRAITEGACTPVEVYDIEVCPPWWQSPVAYTIYTILFLLMVAFVAWAYRRHLRHQADRDKLHLLLSAIHAEDTPLTAEDMRRAIATFVQNRQRQHNTYGNAANVVDKMDIPAVRSDDELLMDRVVQSVNRHLADSEFTTEQLCEEVGLSRAQLHRKMKELTGMPASEFVRGIRLEQAARLLRERKMGIAQVAYSVGFSTAGHFSTVFKKHFGVTPSQFVGQGE